MSWLRRLVASLSLQRPGSVHVGSVVDRVALGQDFVLSSLVFPCHYHSTVALHTQGWTVDLLVATFWRYSLNPLTRITTWTTSHIHLLCHQVLMNSGQEINYPDWGVVPFSVFPPSEGHRDLFLVPSLLTIFITLPSHIFLYNLCSWNSIAKWPKNQSDIPTTNIYLHENFFVPHTSLFAILCSLWCVENRPLRH
jgi:hypothetical protein